MNLHCDVCSFDEWHYEASALSGVPLSIRKCNVKIEASTGTGLGEGNNLCAIESSKVMSKK